MQKRRLIVCCDGTWNSPKNKDQGRPAPTNVRKFYSQIETNPKPKAAAETEQIRYYRSGVGTLGNWATRLLGGAIGYKLEDDIKSAYRFLAENYRPGDHVFLIGFSRGAYTARSLAGMIAKVGLVDLTEETLQGSLEETQKWEIVHAKLIAYQNSKAEGKYCLLRRRNKRLATQLGKVNYSEHSGEQVKIRFLGVWDTVGAMGIPDDMALLKRLMGDFRHHRFHDTDLGTNVDIARHALAIDEMRVDFTPTLWTNYAPERDVKQVWFPGVHGDVGGGYSKAELGDCALKWMMTQAQDAGLVFKEAAFEQLHPWARGVRHDSYSGFFGYRRARPRALPSFASNGDELTQFSDAAKERHGSPRLGEPNYWLTHRLKKNQSLIFRVRARDHWGQTGVFMKADEEYTFRAHGNWKDASILADADGVDSFAHLAFGLSLIPEVVRDLLRRQERTRLADNNMSRRISKAPWFCLIGAVANARGRGEKGLGMQSHQYVSLGKTGMIHADADGYLYCFPNDAWWFYTNNSGSLKVQVTRTK